MGDIIEEKMEEQKLTEKNIEDRKFWYNRVFNLFNIINWSKNRETVFLCGYSRKHNVRYMNVAIIEILKKMLGIQTRDEIMQNKKAKDPFGFFSEKKNYNVYCSLGKIDWSKCPVKAFSYSVGDRIKQQKIFREKLVNYMTDFTGAIDFDGNQDLILMDDGTYKKVDLDIQDEEQVNRSLKDMKVLIKEFNRYGIKWFCQFSGTRGFHILWEIPLDISVNQKVDLTNEMLLEIRKVLDLKTLDGTRYNTRKVFKTPYSLVTKGDKTRVVLPLDDNQIENFKLEDMEVKKVFYNVKGLKDRGVIWRNDSDRLTLTKNFKKFMEDFELKIPAIREH